MLVMQENLLWEYTLQSLQHETQEDWQQCCDIPGSLHQVLISKGKVCGWPLHVHTNPSSSTALLDVQYRKEFRQELIRFNNKKPVLLVVVCVVHNSALYFNSAQSWWSDLK